jgi:hypothetical protein
MRDRVTAPISRKRFCENSRSQRLRGYTANEPTSMGQCVTGVTVTCGYAHDGRHPASASPRYKGDLSRAVASRARAGAPSRSAAQRLCNAPETTR